MAGGRVSHGRVIVEGFIDFDYEITLLTVRALRRRRRGRDAASASRSATCRSRATTSRAGSRTRWRPPRWQRAQRDRQGGHRRPRRAGPVRRRAVRQGRRGLVQRGQPAPARHRHGHDDHAVAERVRAARPRHPRACRWTPRCKSPGASAVIYGGVDAEGVVFDGVADALRVPHTDMRLFGKPRELRQAPHGRGAGARRRRRHRAAPCRRGGAAGSRRGRSDCRVLPRQCAQIVNLADARL